MAHLGSDGRTPTGYAPIEPASAATRSRRQWTSLPGADEGATVAWAQVRTLGETIAEQREELREVRTELRRAEKELDHERGAHLVLEGATTRLRTSVDTLTAENDELRRSIADLRSLLSEQRRPEPSARGPNRAHPHDRSHTRRDG